MTEADSERTRGEGRRGPFWDFLAGKVPAPPAAELLGWKLLDVDPDAGTIRVEFEGKREFLNPIGTIQGGILAAMLDDTMGPALVCTLEPGQFAPTLQLQISFHRPAYPGRLVCEGRVVHRGGNIGFVEGKLFDGEGRLLASATATAKIVRVDVGGEAP